MIQAQQKVVAQEANIALVNIRAFELKYFTNFFLNFTIQALLLVGWISGSISQTPGLDADCHYFFKFIYFVGAAIVLALGVHMMMAGVFLSVFGEGLALRGPEGSMVRAINGLVEEQITIVYVFVGAMFVYVVMQEVGMWFIVMDYPNATVCSVLVLGMLVYTYMSAMRIFNRFWWDKKRTAWQDGDGGDADIEAELNELNPSFVLHGGEPGRGGTKQPEKGNRGNRGKDKRSVTFADETNLRESLLEEAERGSKRSLLQRMGLDRSRRSRRSKKGGDGTGYSSASTAADPDDDGWADVLAGEGATAAAAAAVGESPNGSYNPLQVQQEVFSLYQQDDISLLSDSPYVNISDIQRGQRHDLKVTVAGYMTLKTRRSFPQDPWVRRYFIIRGSLIYYYKDLQAFKVAASKPINKRPIDLEGYALIAGSSEPPYALTLVPLDPNDIRKAWRFRCDTLTEFQNWVDIFSAVLKATVAASSGDVRDSMLIQIPPAS